MHSTGRVNYIQPSVNVEILKVPVCFKLCSTIIQQVLLFLLLLFLFYSRKMIFDSFLNIGRLAFFNDMSYIRLM